MRAIKTTLYRTSKDSEVIKHLVRAARNGKQVAVVLELKARFDEEANIKWASRMERAGIHVTYGVVGLKTHTKITLVVRNDYDGLRRYAHIATGNYHAGTARLYTDLGLFTCDDAIGRDLTELFNYLTTGYKPRRKYQKLLVAPKQLKQSLLEKIEREIANVGAGERGHIQWKLNALEDVDIVRALYRASQRGVTIDLIVRDYVPAAARSRRRVARRSRSSASSAGSSSTAASTTSTTPAAPSTTSARRTRCSATSRSASRCCARSRTRACRPSCGSCSTPSSSDQRGAWDMQPDGSYVQRTGTGAKHSQQSR